MSTDRYNFPKSHIDTKKEYLIDIKHPLMIQKDQLLEDMYTYSRKFPINIIPHVTELGEINDIIHNYKMPKMKDSALSNKNDAKQETERKSEEENEEEDGE